MASLKKAHTRYSGIVSAVLGQEEQVACTAEASKMLAEIVKAFKRVLVDTFDEHCDQGLYTFKYFLFHYKPRKTAEDCEAACL